MDINERIAVSQADIAERIKNTSKREFFLENFKLKQSNRELLEALRQRDIENADLHRLVHDYQKGVEKRILDGLLTLQL